MKPVTKQVLKESANKLLFDLSDEQLTTLENEFGVIIAQMELLKDIEGIDQVEPMTFPFEVSTSALREDEPSEQLDKELALRNANDVVDGQIRLPKVVG